MVLLLPTLAPVPWAAVLGDLAPTPHLEKAASQHSNRSQGHAARQPGVLVGKLQLGPESGAV